MMDSVLPKLAAADVGLLYSLVSDVFPGIEHTQAIGADLRKAVEDKCREQGQQVAGQSLADVPHPEAPPRADGRGAERVRQVGGRC